MWPEEDMAGAQERQSGSFHSSSCILCVDREALHGILNQGIQHMEA